MVGERSEAAFVGIHPSRDTPMPKLYVAFTGDLVKSSRLSPNELTKARRAVTGAAGRLAKFDARLVRGKPEFFRGDAWQMLVTDPAQSLRAALYIRSCLIAGRLCDTRIAMGFGTVKRVNAKRISLSTGEAFTRAGEVLDGMPAKARMDAAAPGEVGGWIRTVVRLCDVMVDEWTARQAEMVGVALMNPDATQNELASMVRPSVTQQTYARGVTGAGWEGLNRALAQFDEFDWSRLR